jgi:hypothetical protein
LAVNIVIVLIIVSLDVYLSSVFNVYAGYLIVGTFLLVYEVRRIKNFTQEMDWIFISKTRV